MLVFLHRARRVYPVTALSFLLLASSSVVIKPTFAQTYTATDLGFAGTGNNFKACKILNDGWIGGSGNYVTGIPYGPGLVGLIRNPNSVTSKFSVATTATSFPNSHDGRSINSSRSLVGLHNPSYNNWPFHAYIWRWNGTTNTDGSLNGTETDLPQFSHIYVPQDGAYHDGVNSEAFDINDAGIVVGTATYPSWVQQPSPHTDQALVGRAFAWDSTASSTPALIDLGTLPHDPGDSNPLDPVVSGARAINNNGQIAGMSNGHLFITTIAYSTPQYDLGRITVNLGASYNNATTYSPYPVGISTGNTSLPGTPVQIAGWIFDTGGRHDAFVWTQTSGASGTVQFLPAAPTSAYDCVEARGINNKGQVVGISYSSTDSVPKYGWVWDTVTGTVTTLPLDEATSINDNGIIVGYQGAHSYQLTPNP